MTPTEAMDRLAHEVMDAYPVGIFVDRAKGIAPEMPTPTGRRAPRPGAPAGSAHAASDAAGTAGEHATEA